MKETQIRGTHKARKILIEIQCERGLDSSALLDTLQNLFIYLRATTKKHQALVSNENFNFFMRQDDVSSTFTRRGIEYEFNMDSGKHREVSYPEVVKKERS